MVRFNAKALYAALDAQRERRGLTWTQVAIMPIRGANGVKSSF